MRGLTWSPDGKTIIADGWKRGAALTPKTYRWDAETGRVLGTVDLPPVIDIPGVGLDNRPARHGSVLAIGGGGLVRLWDTDAVRPLGILALLSDERSLVISPAGHYRGSPGVARELVYVVATDAGTELLEPSDFEQRFGWKNDPSRVGQPDQRQ